MPRYQVREKPVTEEEALKVFDGVIGELSSRYSCIWTSKEDLYQEGCVALIEVYRRHSFFDRGFYTRAYKRIRGAILTYIYHKCMPVRVPINHPSISVFELTDFYDVSYNRSQQWVDLLIDCIDNPVKEQKVLPNLTDGQLEVLLLMTHDGLQAKQAAARLGVPLATVKDRLRCVYLAWEVHSLIEAYNMGMIHGIIPPP